MKTAQAPEFTLVGGERIVCIDHPAAGVMRDRREIQCAACGAILWAVPDDDTWPEGEAVEAIRAEW